MNEYSPFDEKQTEYIRKCQTSWLNVAEGGKRGAKNVVKYISFLYSVRKPSGQVISYRRSIYIKCKIKHYRLRWIRIKQLF